MAYEQLKSSALPRAVADIAADLADLFQKELRLARAEISSKLSVKLRGGIWMAAAVGCGALAGLLVVEAIVFAIAETGIAVPWSCLIVAGGLVVIGLVAYALGRANMREELTPNRTIRQIKQDVATARERFT